jgi:hypothetical protein
LKSNKPFGYLALNKIAKKAITTCGADAPSRRVAWMPGAFQAESLGHAASRVYSAEPSSGPTAVDEPCSTSAPTSDTSTLATEMFAGAAGLVIDGTRRSRVVRHSART